MPIIFPIILIILGVRIPIDRSWQTPILVLCAEWWLISVQEHLQCFGMNRRALFIKISQDVQLNEDYNTHYLFYYTYHFECLTRIAQLVTSIDALQADIQRIYEVYNAMESRRKLFLLSQGPNSCPFFCIIHIMSLLFAIMLMISKLETAIWVRIHCRKLANPHIHHRWSVSIQPKSINDSIRKHQSVFSHWGSCLNHPIGPIRLGLTDELQTTRFKLIAQCIDSHGNGSAFFLPDVICNSEINQNLHNNWHNQYNVCNGYN